MTDRANDIELVSGCIKNDRRAQELLYKQFHNVMATVCMRYTRQPQDTMEVLQTGFMKVYKNIHRFDARQASLFTWIRKIMINTAIDFLRQKKNWVALDEQVENTKEVVVDSDAVQKLSAQELLKLVQQLPPATQAVFNLYVVEGYMHKEIAVLLGIKEGTSKWHLSEARRMLQQILPSNIMQER